jgi:precorrin-3B methylase
MAAQPRPATEAQIQVVVAVVPGITALLVLAAQVLSSLNTPIPTQSQTQAAALP